MKPETILALENADWPALLLDHAGTICRANQAASKLFGSALEGQSPRLSAIWSPENNGSADQFQAQWEGTSLPIISLKFRAEASPSLSFLTSVCAFTQDDQKYLLLQLLPPNPCPGTEPQTQNGETSFISKQKLESALRLARTVSLDLNNALSGVVGHTSFLLNQLEPNHACRNSLIEIGKSAGRAAEIASDLGAFSHQHKQNREPTTGNLNALVQRSVESFQSDPDAPAVEWIVRPERKLFAAKFDETRLQQALSKILENALESLTGNGRITIQTRNLELTEPTQDRNAQLAAGAYVCIEISDNGCGITPENLPRIFEPFFTTKPRAEHPGLGLALVYGIMTNQGGRVAVSSQPGTGTSVRVYLPAQQNSIQEDGVSSNDLSGNQTILIVDDEELLLTMGKTILAASGYKILTANSGQKALEALSQKQAAVDLVITDLVMPIMSGPELIEHVHRLSPQMPILFISGCVRPAGQHDGATYLTKPFTSQQLLVKVKGLLNGKGNSNDE